MKHKRRIPTLIRKFILIALIAGFFVGGFGLFWMATLDIPDFSSFDQRLVTESTKIYDKTGKVLLYDVHGTVRRTIIPFENISKDIKNATVAIEDSEFYQHKGVKPTAILRAFLVNLVSGRAAQGGSTITQQAVKNALLTKEKKITRKIKEAILALKMEQALSKEQILSIYLNESPYGGAIYGVEEAAQAFFGKPASEVTLAEAAYLAALPQAPTYYSPYGKHRDKLDERKNVVLRRMRELKFITEEQENLAKTERVTFLDKSERGIKAPHFVMFVKDYLEQKYGEEAVETKGLKVITTLDWELQQKAEEIVKEYAEQNAKSFNASNGALVAIDPKTGHILAMVGSRDYFDETVDGNFNVALAHRQPGSSFKPFVYAQAFNKGFTPETVLFDLPTQFDTTCAKSGNCYTPVNYDGRYRGPITLRSALGQSINIPAIKVLYLAGIKDSLNLARSMGIESLGNWQQYGLTLVLGGGEVSLLDMTSAYSVFANDGVRNPYVEILKVEDGDGKVLEEYAPAPRQVLPSNTARLISGILSDNSARLPTFPVNSPLNFTSRQVAAKTGTTNDYKDAWVIGYTPGIAVGAWVGNNDNTPMEKKVAGLIVTPMWRAFMDHVLSKQANEPFPTPEPLDPELPPIYRGFWQGNQSYVIDKASGKLATEDTPEDMREERVVRGVHSILYWLGRTNDSQYELWEAPIRTWALQNGHGLDESTNVIPAATDDIHTASNRPSFNINSPRDGENFNPEDKVTVKIEDYRGKFPLAQVDVFVNDTFVDSIKREPFQLSFVPENLEDIQSRNKLRVIVYDQMRNKREKTIDFEVDN